MKTFTPVLLLSALFVSACTFVEVEYDEPAIDEAQSSAAAESEPIRETNNVTYTGEIQPAGISIYQQGSHRLVLPGGKFILLESETVDLNGYVGETVQIFGALRPTVEAGGMIMRVDEAKLVLPEKQEEPAEAAEEDEPTELEEEDEDPTESDDSESESSEVSEDEVSSASDDSESSLAEETKESDQSSAPDDSVDSSAESTNSVAAQSDSPAYQARIQAMATQDFAASNWTQQYCTSHIGFCAPVHRNWWFKSFGATSSSLWHVELNSEPLEVLGDGPVVIDLFSGSIADQDRTVELADGQAMGYREWTFGRHFRITADESLEAAVRYITENIVSQE